MVVDIVLIFQRFRLENLLSFPISNNSMSASNEQNNKSMNNDRLIRYTRVNVEHLRVHQSSKLAYTTRIDLYIKSNDSE